MAEPAGFIGQLVMAVIGAVIVLWLAAKLRK
ncbi:MAG: GlsB/YeaQ/YmgE family stress response membrane protein [Bacteroidaceae bacterium]|nr:GlsB/YeaQ/YmgE family stress response membrane protein [Bacteroidaceae bacterium]